MSYNGWHNYETWRVHLEVFDGLELDAGEYGEIVLKDMAAQTYLQDVENTYAEGLILSFLNAVDWWEIADSLKEETSDAN